MALVASTDYSTKRIFLGPDSIGVNILPIDIYKEVRAERRLNTTKRTFYPMIRSFGNEPAGPSNTPRFTVLESGVRIVPYDASATLLVTGALISTTEGLAGADLFDRSPLSPGVEVDIDYQPPQVEIITINTGGGGAVVEHPVLRSL